MNNNYYASIYYKFNTNCKGLNGTFEGHHNYFCKYGFNDESIEQIVTNVRKYIKEDNAEINFYIDNLDWYGAPKVVVRLLREFNGKISLVTWEEGESYGNRTELSSRDIRKMVNNYLTSVKEYVESHSEDTVTVAGLPSTQKGKEM